MVKKDNGRALAVKKRDDEPGKFDVEF